MELNIKINLSDPAFENGGTNEAIRCVTEALESLRGQWDDHRIEIPIIASNKNQVGTATYQPEIKIAIPRETINELAMKLIYGGQFSFDAPLPTAESVADFIEQFLASK